VRAYIYAAKQLPPCDDTGASDPYIECWPPYKERDKKPVKDRITGKDKEPQVYNYKTQFCEQTNNPLYYEAKEIL